MGQENRGAKIGPRVAMLVSQSIVATHQKLIGTKHKLAMAVFNSMSDEISKEVDDTIGPVLNLLLSDKTKQDKAYGLLNFMAKGHGQLKALSGTQMVGQSLLWAVSTILNNELAIDVYAAVGSNPNSLPDPGTLATLAAGGFIDEGTAVSAIGQNGIGSSWADAMVKASASYPGAADLLDMLRREIIDPGTFLEIAKKSGIDEVSASQYIEQQFLPLSPAEAALAVLRNNIDPGAAESAAKHWGVTPQDFQTMVDNTGEPLGLEQLLEAFRRGFIDQGRLDRGIKQSRVRDEWADVATALRYSPMSVSDAARAVVQNQMDENTGAAIAQDNGLEPGMFDILVRTEGNPLSRTEMEELYNRQLVTKDEVLQAVRESRTKNKYVELAFELHTRLLEPRTLSTAVYEGALSHADAVKIALEYGYSPRDAEVLVSGASMRKLRTYRERIVTSAEALYEQNAITPDQMMTIAQSMGFDQTEAQLIISSADYHRQAKAVTSVISAVRSKYVGHHITREVASQSLDALGISLERKQFLLNLWDIEVANNVRMLTPAQVVKALNNKLIGPDEATSRLVFMGYSADDAALLLAGA